jgi:hypothetical protein
MCARASSYKTRKNKEGKEEKKKRYDFRGLGAKEKGL